MAMAGPAPALSATFADVVGSGDPMKNVRACYRQSRDHWGHLEPRSPVACEWTTRSFIMHLIWIDVGGSSTDRLVAQPSPDSYLESTRLGVVTPSSHYRDFSQVR